MKSELLLLHSLRLLTSVTLTAFLSLPVTAVSAETFTIGMHTFDPGINWLDSETLVAELVRAGVGSGLVRKVSDRALNGSAPWPVTLDLSDSMNVSQDQKLWSFRLRADLSFRNGESVSGDDVVFSLERCKQKGGLSFVKRITLKEQQLTPDLIRTSVEIELPDSPKALLDQNGAVDFPAALANCPILDQETALAFGSDWAKGTNLVSAGRYYLSAFAEGREVVLTSSGNNSREAAVILRGYGDDSQGLTALRSGSVDAFFARDHLIIEKGRRDSTLTVSSCLGHSVIYRKGLNLNCASQIRLEQIKYSG